jgi:hypothetical protein
MENIAEGPWPSTSFVLRQALIAARHYPGLTQLIALTLAHKTSAQGVVTMTADDVAFAVKKSRPGVLPHLRTLERDGLLIREAPRSYSFTWNMPRVAELAKEVRAREVARESEVASRISILDTHPDFRAVWLAAERKARASKEGSLRFGASLEPRPEGWAWLCTFADPLGEKTGRSLEAIAVTTWRNWLRVAGRIDKAGRTIDYKKLGHPFSYMVQELKLNHGLQAEIHRSLARRDRVIVEPAAPSSMPVQNPVDVAREAMRACGGAS